MRTRFLFFPCIYHYNLLGFDLTLYHYNFLGFDLTWDLGWVKTARIGFAYASWFLQRFRAHGASKGLEENAIKTCVRKFWYCAVLISVCDDIMCVCYDIIYIFFRYALFLSDCARNMNLVFSHWLTEEKGHAGTSETETQAYARTLPLLNCCRTI